MKHPMILLNALLLIAVFIELVFDKGSAEALDEGGRTEKENDIIHGQYLPARGYMIVLSLIVTVVVCDLNWTQTGILAGYSLFFYWMAFDLACVFFWLRTKKNALPWYYDGTGNDKRNMIIKITGLIICYVNWIVW